MSIPSLRSFHPHRDLPVEASVPRGRRTRSILSKAIVPLGLWLALSAVPDASADTILAPTDTVLGGQVVTGAFQVGVVGTAAGVNNWPGGELPALAIDGTQSKYLNFG